MDLSQFHTLTPAQQDVVRQKLKARLDALQVDTAKEALSFVTREVQRRRWRNDVHLWAKERLGVHLWSKQVEIANSVKHHRRTLVQSAHDLGKSFISAIIACWWIDTNAPGEAFVVTSAPTAPQVSAILWREMRKVHQMGNLGGRMNQTEWYIDVNGTETLVAFGRKPDEYNPTAFQGIHAPKVLVIMDEGCGIRGNLWEAADSLIANDSSKILTIGNPDEPIGEFFENAKPNSRWHVIQISAFDSPNFTGEVVPRIVSSQLIGRTYVEEKRDKWAPAWTISPDFKSVTPPGGVKLEDSAHPFWFSKVLGQFPENAEDGGLIPISWVRRAQRKSPEERSALAASNLNELGCDVGGGGDESTIAHRLGGVVRVIRSDRNPDTMQTCGNIIHALRTTNATTAKVDVIGIGRGVVDRGKELNEPFVGVNVGCKSREEEFYLNLRAESFWTLRERFETDSIAIDPLDEELAEELIALRYKRISNGRIQIESKDEYRRRTKGRSPNRADAVNLAFMVPIPEEDEYEGATW